MKKLICLVLAALTAIASLSLTASAEEESSSHEKLSSMIVFGDSIPAGFALEGYSALDNTKAKDCFVNSLCSEYGLEFDSSCMNYSYKGLDTNDILKRIRNTDKDIIKNSDVIIISAGANDIMDIIETAVISAFLEEKDYFESKGVEIDTGDLLSYEKSIFSVITNPDVKDGTDRIYAVCTSDNNKRTYTDAVLKAESNIKDMISYIRETGSSAEIFFLVPYDPTEIITGNPLLDTARELLNDYRDRLIAVCNSSEYGYSANAIDLLTEFKGRAMELTNISSFDIHPNKKGHQMIARLTADLIDSVMTEKERESSLMEMRSAPYSDTVVYIIFAIACTAVILVMIIGVIKYKRKEL